MTAAVQTKRPAWMGWALVALAFAMAAALDLRLVPVLAIWVGGWVVNALIAQRSAARWGGYIIPVIFGVTLLLMWEVGERLFEISDVLLPAPSEIAARFWLSRDILWVDFVQTVIKGALSGFVMGCGAAFLLAVVIDRFPFLQLGLLPVGNFVAALPIVGMAPILVMWFGFDWQSKAAVVVVMVFFPMLVNTVQGLQSSDAMQRDLMRTYAAGYWQTLLKLRLPAAMPFIFNGLKIASTLALIGAIVAEFFGSPIKGMGFRISTSVGQLALDLVWAEIVVAATVGSAFYGGIALLERVVTFWHPSQRGRT
ncbi:ABC transporter permease [Photobacterium sp. TY 1-4]|uniref:ABC transporter permease n=2 Tax=Pseudosulfitobacter koreensis TaxID=2968472 RepID=A0ABT1Z3I7_9RHOB|nr:ABC transporter permease [Pseudosulfitobacter koreense]